MIEIRRLETFDEAAFRKVATGYQALEAFEVKREEVPDRVAFTLKLTRLGSRRNIKFTHVPKQMEMYRDTVKSGGGRLYGAFSGDRLVGLALAEPKQWNRTLWVWEIHVAEDARGNGIGRRLMETLATWAKNDGLRAIVCEAQASNVPAIRFYRAMGFTMHGVDISYYSNEDLRKQDIAVFMKREME